HLAYFGRHRLSAIDAKAIDAYTRSKVEERKRITEAKPARDAAIAPLEEERRKARNRGDRERGRELTVRIGELRRTRGLSNSSVNHTVRILSAILEDAVDYGLIPSNPAASRRRRLKTSTPARPWVEPQQLTAFLAGATGVGRVLLGLLCGTGLRIDEALE